jgi:hypothetical protein
MLTPAFSLTSTERVLPKLALDFTTGLLDSRVTCTRTTSASNPATYFASSGEITLATNNQPRFDYTSASVCKGLLIEESRANLFLYSVLTKSGSLPNSWSQSIPGGTQDTITSIYGSADGATAWTQTASSARPFFIPNGGVTVLANTSYFFSLYLETNPNNIDVRNIVNYGSTPSGTVQWYIDSTAVANTTVPTAPCRVGMLFTIGATGGLIYPRIGLGGQTTVTGTIQFSRPQWEAGAFATSYIPTTTTSLTRNADVVTMTGTNFSDWYNATEGTFGYEYLRPSGNAASSGRVFASGVGGSNSYGVFVLVATTTQDQIYIRDISGDAVSGVFVSATSGIINKGTISYKVDDFAWAYNGASPTTDTSGVVPSQSSELRIGRAINTNGAYLNGHIRKLNYWPQRLTNNEVRAFSK